MYSQITGLSNNASPSSVTKVGIFDSGLFDTRSGGDTHGSVPTMVIWPSIPQAMAQAITLRA